MRQRKETWILTFAGTTQAMQMEQYARAHGLPGRMIPVPREIMLLSAQQTRQGR